jgi:hypothetical protein
MGEGGREVNVPLKLLVFRIITLIPLSIIAFVLGGIDAVFGTSIAWKFFDPFRELEWRIFRKGRRRKNDHRQNSNKNT